MTRATFAALAACTRRASSCGSGSRHTVNACVAPTWSRASPGSATALPVLAAPLLEVAGRMNGQAPGMLVRHTSSELALVTAFGHWRALFLPPTPLWMRSRRSSSPGSTGLRPVRWQRARYVSSDYGPRSATGDASHERRPRWVRRLGAVGVLDWRPKSPRPITRRARPHTCRPVRNVGWLYERASDGSTPFRFARRK